MDTFLTLLTTISSLGSLVFVWLAYKLASEYLSQHEAKISIELRRKATEDALRALLMLDHTLQRMFQALNIDIDRYQKMKECSVKHCADLPDTLKQNATEKLLSLFIFQDNFKKKEQELTSLTKELQLNILLLKSVNLNEHYSKLDKSIASMINVFFSESKYFWKENCSPEEASKFAEATPLNMNDNKNSLIIDYNQIGTDLRDVLLSKL